MSVWKRGVSLFLLTISLGMAGCGITQNWSRPYTPPADYKEDQNPFVRIVIPDEQASKGAEAQNPDDKRDKTGIGENKNAPPAKHLAPPLPVEPLASGHKSVKTQKEVGQPVHVELAFDNADIYEVLDVTLYDLFGLSYMVDPAIKTAVTFHIVGDYTKDQFINTFNQALQLNGLSIVHGAGNIYKILPKPGSAGNGNAPAAVSGDRAEGDITRMIRLRYVAVAAAATNIAPFLSKGAQVVQDTVNNALLMTDAAENIDKAVSILGVIDVEYFADISWQIFPLKEVDVATVAADLDSVFKSGGLYKRQGAVEGSFEIVPIKSMNAILVVSRWPSILTLVQDWIQAMDHMTESETNVFVYFVENGSAVDLSDTLHQVFLGSSASSGSRSSKSSASKSKSSGLTSGMGSSGGLGGGSSLGGGGLGGSSGGLGSSGLGSSTSSNKQQTIVKPTASVSGKAAGDDFSGTVEITADESNNAILFKANNRDYQRIYKVLKQLDVQPRQVLINVLIAEVSLNGSTQYGVQWLLNSTLSGGTTVQNVLDNKAGLVRNLTTPLGSDTGFTLGVFDATNFLRGLMYMVDSDSDVKILSCPNILALDNKEASIEVGTDVPTQTASTTSLLDANTVTSSIQYRTVGVLLTVTPHINSSGLVKMDLTQEVSALGTYEEALNNYQFLTRKADTSLVVSDGQTVVLGGMMQTNVTNSQAGIPYLKDIPILGYLFGGVSKSSDKTELIIMITPHVIKSRADADEITREFSEKLKYLNGSSKEKKKDDTSGITSGTTGSR